MLLYLLIPLLCLVYFHMYNARYSEYRRIINQLPGPTPLPIFGNVFMFLNKHPEEVWHIINRLIKEHYPLVRVWFFIKAMVFIVDPDDLKVLLSDTVNITKGYIYDPLFVFVKAGLITSTGEKWHQRRAMITQAFHRTITKKCIEFTSEQAEQLIELIKAQGDASVHIIKPMCSHLILNILIETALGVKHKISVHKAEEYRHALECIFNTVAHRATKPYIQDWMLKFSYEGRKTLASVKIAHDFADEIIEDRRKCYNQVKYKSSQIFDNKEDSDSGKEYCNEKLPLLDLLLLAQKEGFIDEHGTKEEVNTYISAGYDATRVAMVYMLMFLAENKEVQTLARDETYKILTASGGKVTMKEIQKMDYIDRCIKETLRLFPSAPYLSRTLIKDIQLKNGLIPAGTDVFFPVHCVHRDPKYWPDPMKFNPDRHLPQEVSKRHSFSYIPFSHGSRNCIGQKFGVAMMKTFIAHVLLNFYLEPVDYINDLQFKVHVVLLPTTEPKIKFIKIKK